PHTGVLELHRTLLGLRKSHPALRTREFDVAELGPASLALRRRSAEQALLLVVNLKGEIRVDLAEREVTRAPEARFWKVVLATEEPRFGGQGGWGRVEPEGTLHLMGPVSVLVTDR